MKKKMQKWLQWIPVFLLLLVMSACAGKEQGDGQQGDVPPVTQGTPEMTKQPEATNTPQLDENGMTADMQDALELTSIELANLLGNGINLGNTMEAYGRASLGINSPISRYETYWGQPVTTQEMITGMKEAGFDTLRIPVAWTNGMKFESGDYTIRKELLDRVEEIVNYALKEDMYVIINDHWDGGWWGMFGSATEETRNKAMDMFCAMWTQLAERFKNYDEHVIFEAANEELGDRLNDMELCPDGGTLSDTQCYKMLTEITQEFVNLVRESGGNNAVRFLLIPGYNTDIDRTCDKRFVMPTDTAKEKLLLSVHYYKPDGYCLDTSLSSWGSALNYEEQNTRLAKMEKFTKQGYGIVIGEYAVSLKDDGTLKDNTYEFFDNFLNNCDLYGYCPVLWDCSSLYKRSKLTMIDQDIAALFRERSYESQSSFTLKQITENAKKAIDAAYEKAQEKEVDFVLTDDMCIAWIMFNSGDWGITYSVGDVYDPTEKTDRLVVTDVDITGEGTYTVGLDFTKTGNGYANKTAFCALGIANGEKLYPGYVINIKEILINGEAYTMKGKPYTTSDDKKCTRVNLYNAWISPTPTAGRTVDGSLAGATPVLLGDDIPDKIKTLTVTFDYQKK